MIKIIHILTDTNLGGAGVWLLNFLRAYDREKYDVSVALPEGAILCERVTELGVRVHEVKHIADMSYSKNGVRELKELFLHEKPDIVHCHASLSARIAAKLCRIPVVNTRHCIEEPMRFPKNTVYSIINNSLSDIIIGVSEKTCENLIECGTKKSKIRLVYNGVFPVREISSDEKEKVRFEYGIPKGNAVIGLIARLEPVKNPLFLLDAAKLVLEAEQNVSFLIVGGGSLDREMREKAKSLGISENVIFTGTLDDITSALNIIDILTLTSAREALSLSLIEGMTLGKPAVSTASGGPSEVLCGDCGIITPIGDAGAFATALISYLRSPEKMKEAGDNGKKRAGAVFSIDAMMSSLDKIYSEISGKESK